MFKRWALAAVKERKCKENKKNYIEKSVKIIN